MRFDGQRRSDVFKMFKEKMSYNTFLQIWIGRVCKTIDMHVYDN